MAALTQFSYLAADTIVNGSATSHLAPTDPADRKWAPGLTHMAPMVDPGSRVLASDPRWGLLPGLPGASPLTDLSPQA